MVELVKAHKTMEDQKGHVNNLLEDGWFFGNTLLSNNNKPRPTMMVSSNSYITPSSNTNEETNLIPQNHISKASDLLGTPSLPPCLGEEAKNEQEIEDDEPRMGDLIMQAMPMSYKRLDRMSSLPSFRGKEALNMEPNFQIGSNEVERLTRRVSIDSSILLSKKDHMVLPPKYSSKGTKQSASNSDNRSQRKPEPITTTSPSKTKTRGLKLDKIKSQKSLNNLEIKELQGFKDLGFSFDERKPINRPYLSEWQTWATDDMDCNEQKQPLTKDVKAQIKYWAKSVAYNVK